MAHNGDLYIPFAMADKSTSFVCIGIDTLVDELRRSPLRG
jgi:hypothetical protein